MTLFNLVVLSQTKTHFNGLVRGVFVPTIEGEIEVLKGHAMIISKLKTGNIRYFVQDEEHKISVQGGFLKVEKDKTVLIIF